MPRQNRALPTGEIIAHPARGLFMGNRGCLHDATGSILRSHGSQKAWIICETVFEGRKRNLMTPGWYTELFFLDEAVALSAGHRPCAECRRADYVRFRDAWTSAFGQERPKAPEMDAALAQARRSSTGEQLTHWRRLRDLPDGCFVATSSGAALWIGDRLLPFTPAGYGASFLIEPATMVEVLTPEPTVLVLAAGYRPRLHPSAGQN